MIAPSRLDNKCPRFLWRAGRGESGEVIPDESGQTGLDIEKIICDAIQHRKSTYKIDSDEHGLPEELLIRPAEFQKEINYRVDGVPVKGYIDIYYPTQNWVVDIKSAYPLTGAQTKWKYQMGAYALPFWDRENDIPPRVSIFFARHGVLIDIDPLHYSIVENRIREVIEICQEPEEPRPRPSGFCYLCAFNLSCPEVPEIIDTPPAELVKQLLVLDAKVENIRRALSEWTAHNGTLDTPEATVGHFPQETLQITLEFWEKIQEQGIDPLQLVNPDKRKVMKLVKTVPELENLVHIATTKTKFTVKPKRLEEGGE